MTCARGCCETQAEHYRSVGFAHPERRSMTKVTVERDSKIEVDVTEHWHDRQDLLVKPKSISVKGAEVGITAEGLGLDVRARG